MSHHLLEIQRLDVSVDQSRHRRVHLDERAALDQALADQQARQQVVDQVAAGRVEVATRQRRLEDEAQMAADRAEKGEGRLYGGEVTGLKDLEALQHEIAGLRERQAGLEDQVLEAMEEADELSRRITILESDRAGADERVAALTAEIARQEAEIDTEVDKLQDRRAELADGVDAALLAEYERLRPAFGAATAVTFEGGACVGCPSSMPAMEVDRLRHLDGDEPASCGECGRIVLR